MNLDSVLRWRNEQEDKLRTAGHPSGSGIMTSAEVERFVQFFERVSRDTEAQVERTADVVLTLDEDHDIQSVKYA